jgi:hypothetical protein
LARLNDTLGGNEQHVFERLTGFHPARVGVATHRDAIRYVAHVDLYNRQQQGQPQAGLLALAMGRTDRAR